METSQVELDEEFHPSCPDYVSIIFVADGPESNKLYADELWYKEMHIDLTDYKRKYGPRKKTVQV